MAYKWKPSKAQKKAFAEKMKDPNEQAAYYLRREKREQKRRQDSKFDYETAGGYYVPTKDQFLFCVRNPQLVKDPEIETAFNQVMFGFGCKEKVHHDHIHIVNELRRKHPNN